MKKILFLTCFLFSQDLHSSFVSRMSVLGVLLVSCVSGMQYKNHKSPWESADPAARQRAINVLSELEILNNYFYDSRDKK